MGKAASGKNIFKWTYSGSLTAIPTGLIFTHDGEQKFFDNDLAFKNHGYYVEAVFSKEIPATGGGSDPTDPSDPSGDFTVYFDNASAGWSQPYVHYWGGESSSSWPGKAMTLHSGNIWKATVAAGTTELVFNVGSNADQTKDFSAIANHLYNKSGDQGEYSGTTPTPTKPVVSASPASGTTFTESVTVTLSVTPSTATIYYTTDGSTPSASSSVYSSPLTFTATTTLKTFAKTTDGGTATNSFTYTKKSGTDPVEPSDPVEPGKSLNTNYYKTNPNGQVGTNKTINMSFSGQKSTTALSNWTPDELIAQGVARDVCMAFKGPHERPVVDSYALYAAYDNDNLYLGVQFVYEVWDIYGEGKQPGESKPYNMDGHMCIAFDLFADKQMDGVLTSGNTIWDGQGVKGTTFNNGVDAVWMGSTKPGVGNPGFFTPTPDGHASYDAAYCKLIKDNYGYADGLLPSITSIYGQEEFRYDPELLKGNSGFVDLISEIDHSAHTFYEWKFPLSLLGITKSHIENNGIGVMYIDKYGSSGVGSTPYDPTFFDNVFESYGAEASTSHEKDDTDVVTYKCARIGKLITTDITDTQLANKAKLSVRAMGGKLCITADKAQTVTVTSAAGMTKTYTVTPGQNIISGLAKGVYIVNGRKVAL